MEEVLAGLAALVGHAPVATDDAVADGALGLALHCADNVAPESRKAINDTPALANRKRVSVSD